jgi:hypothetical protein
MHSSSCRLHESTLARTAAPGAEGEEAAPRWPGAGWGGHGERSVRHGERFRASARPRAGPQLRDGEKHFQTHNFFGTKRPMRCCIQHRSRNRPALLAPLLPPIVEGR